MLLRISSAGNGFGAWQQFLEFHGIDLGKNTARGSMGKIYIKKLHNDWLYMKTEHVTQFQISLCC